MIKVDVHLFKRFSDIYITIDFQVPDGVGFESFFRVNTDNFYDVGYFFELFEEFKKVGNVGR